ncbi:hypothetical protein HYT84_04360 [Candidatus Micrarchaeota archaeon]|nr:hypothetical protein [Candidatus Micrarchaeota archaeon]
MCNLVLEGTRAVLDMSKCPYEFASPEFLNLHFKDLATIEAQIKTIKYEEELVIELDESKALVLTEYANVIKQVESLLLREDVYGSKQDPQFDARRQKIRKFYEYMFVNPLIAARELEEHKEDIPEKQIFMKGYQTFRAWVNGILKRFTETHFYSLVKKSGDIRAAFLSLVGLKSLYFVNSIVLDIPKDAKPVKSPEATYSLPYDIQVQIYELPEEEAHLYIQSNPLIDNLSADLKKLLKRVITEQIKESFQMDIKTREYRQYFLDQAILQGTQITQKEALAMGREAAAWAVGLGAPLENLALDKTHITDIYVDSENAPIYMEHTKFGICHTLYRYNRDLLEHAFNNIVYTQKGVRKFDENSPIVDVVLKRHMMRCHLQRPPATFEELQGALRLMKEEPFTYAQYIDYNSFSPFFCGYDVHIGAARVQSSEREESVTKELDLVSMANALLRMGDAALIINEVRSRVAVQGIINLLNTQPGVFLLYNLHAESLRDIQDRLELVFGIPSASMFATDRYTFLKKIRFGRRARVYRVLGYEFETDQDEKKFVEIFRFKRGAGIEQCVIEPKFIKNPEAQQWNFDKIDLAKMEKDLDIAFIPPALVRRSEETGISPEQYILQAFFKGKLYYDIYSASKELEDKLLIELDFVLKCNTVANKLLSSLESEEGGVDFKEARKKWEPMFKQLVKDEIAAHKVEKGK